MEGAVPTKGCFMCLANPRLQMRSREKHPPRHLGPLSERSTRVPASPNGLHTSITEPRELIQEANGRWSTHPHILDGDEVVGLGGVDWVQLNRGREERAGGVVAPVTVVPIEVEELEG